MLNDVLSQSQIFTCIFICTRVFGSVWQRWATPPSTPEKGGERKKKKGTLHVIPWQAMYLGNAGQSVEEGILDNGVFFFGYIGLSQGGEKCMLFMGRLLFESTLLTITLSPDHHEDLLRSRS
jgi:hypothetical protein